MAYVVSPACVFCNAHACARVCPVDCFYEDETQVYIHPDECIDCGACEPECPTRAITTEEEATPADIVLNRDRSTWPDVQPCDSSRPARAPFSDDEHRSRRGMLLTELRRAAGPEGEALVRSVERLLPDEPLLAGGRPATPFHDELIEVLRAGFPDRWVEHLETIRSLTAVPPTISGDE